MADRLAVLDKHIKDWTELEQCRKRGKEIEDRIKQREIANPFLQNVRKSVFGGPQAQTSFEKALESGPSQKKKRRVEEDDSEEEREKEEKQRKKVQEIKWKDQRNRLKVQLKNEKPVPYPLAKKGLRAMVGLGESPWDGMWQSLEKNMEEEDWGKINEEFLGTAEGEEM